MPLEILFIIAGSIAAGGALGWVMHRFKSERDTVPRADLEKLREELNSAISRLAAQEEKARAAESQRQKIEEELKKTVEETARERRNLESALGDSKTEARVLSERLDTHKQEITEMRVRFNAEFGELASRIFDEKTKKFTELNQDNLGRILTPLKDNIDDLKKRMDTDSKETIKLGAQLSTELKNLMGLNQKMSEEAKNLTTALKGNSKTMGDWGEEILGRILENSGLQKGREYTVQESSADELGRQFRPDVIVYLPDDKKIIVDSKVSLTAYERWSSSETKNEQDSSIREHYLSVKKHIDDLAGKDYAAKVTGSIDYVMMFMPIEPALSAVLSYDAGIWSYAYSRNVILVTPTSLIAALMIIANLWKKEAQNRNIMEIVSRAEKMYDKFATFVNTMTEIESGLDTASKGVEKAKGSYRKVLDQLKDGRGNLIDQFETLRKLGLKPAKQIPREFISDDRDETA